MNLCFLNACITLEFAQEILIVDSQGEMKVSIFNEIRVLLVFPIERKKFHFKKMGLCCGGWLGVLMYFVGS